MTGIAIERARVWWLLGVAALVVTATPAAAQLNNGRMARPEVDLPRGPVRQVILTRCATCHGIDDYAYHALDRAGWRALVETMEDKGATLSDGDRSVLLDWLVSEFGPHTTPFPRDYVVTPVDDEIFADGETARAYLTATCGACHSLDRVDTARFDGARWIAIVADMRTRGAAVAEENVEALVAYLTHAYGEGP